MAKILGGLSPHLINIGGAPAPLAPPSYATAMAKLAIVLTPKPASSQIVSDKKSIFL